MYFLSSSIMTFIKEMEPILMNIFLLNVDHIKEKADTKILIISDLMPKNLRIYIATAARTIGKTQYPNTQTHWKKDICPPSSLVFIVTTKAPPHIIKNKTPKDFPLS